MPAQFIEYKKAPLNTNCPECYATDGLMVVFSYKHEENKFFKRATEEVKTAMYCTTCETDIYPSQWTDDIERVYDYNKKLAQPPKAYFKFKLFSLILLLSIIVIGVALAFLVMRGGIYL